MSAPRPENETQLAKGLPGLTHHITGHNPSGRAIVQATTPAKWTPLLNDTMAFNVVYTTSKFPPDMTNDADLQAHTALLQKKELGLVNPNGTVARIVDFGPNSEPVMHRTKSLDYGIVLEGEVEMILDDGVKKVMRRGDVAVQRATNHGWRNTSETEWARMFFVLQDSEKLVVGGKELGEDLSNAGDAGTGH
ncbi:hypothetical protein ACLMJK_007067 [Lecanora helva]